MNNFRGMCIYYVCTCVCMYVGMYVCMYICMYVCMQTWLYVLLIFILLLIANVCIELVYKTFTAAILIVFLAWIQQALFIQSMSYSRVDWWCALAMLCKLMRKWLQFFLDLLLNWLVEPCRVKTGTLVIQIFHTSKNWEEG